MLLYLMVGKPRVPSIYRLLCLFCCVTSMSDDHVQKTGRFYVNVLCTYMSINVYHVLPYITPMLPRAALLRVITSFFMNACRCLDFLASQYVRYVSRYQIWRQIFHIDYVSQSVFPFQCRSLFIGWKSRAICPTEFSYAELLHWIDDLNSNGIAHFCCWEWGV